MIYKPKITVLMSVYNGQDHLEEAIESILNQTFSDFEFLIINDASSDNSLEIIKSFQDKRIRLVQNDFNIGLTKSLNKGINLANGELIARMDCDDISLPGRFSEQVSFMDQNQEVGICGTWFRIIKKRRVISYPIEHERIKCDLLFKNMIAHPTVMMRKALIQKYNLYYDPELITAQDYELWIRASQHIKLANIPRVLLYYRIHEKQVSFEKPTAQKANSLKRIRSQLETFMDKLSEDELELHASLLLLTNYNVEEVKKLNQWFERIESSNISKKVYDPKQLNLSLQYYWLKTNFHPKFFNLNVFLQAVRSKYFSLSTLLKVFFYEELYLLIKSDSLKLFTKRKS